MRDDRDPLGTSAGDDGADVVDILDGIRHDGGPLLWDPDSADHEDGGLEIDQAQEREVRDIFLTTLPHYLEPIEQMLDQLFDQTSGATAETRSALLETLASLSNAASRIGFDEVYEHFRHMSLILEQVSEQSTAKTRADVHAALRHEVERIHHIAGGSGAPAPADRAGSSRTIVSVLRDLDGVDESVLSQLTSAGLVSVDQLLMAAPDEIVAVSGLDAALVDRLLDSLARHEAARVREPTAAAGAHRDAADDATNVVELTLDAPKLQAQLARKRQKRSSVEAALEDARTRVQELTEQLGALRREVSTAEFRKDQLRAELTAMRAKAAERALELKRARNEREVVYARCARAQKAVAAREQQILELVRQRDAVMDERTRLHRQVAGLVDEVSRMLENMSRR